MTSVVKYVLPLLLLSCSSWSEHAEAKRILFYFGISTYSHRISVWPLVERLAEEGHNITFVSAYPAKALANPKVFDYVPKSLETFVPLLFGGSLLDARFTTGSEVLWFTLIDASIAANNELLKDKEFVEWYKAAEFDLIYIDSFFSELIYGLAYRTRAPFAIVCTTVPYPWQGDALGLANEQSWLPDMQWHYPEDMSLFQRVMNTLRPLQWNFYRWFTYYPAVAAQIKSGLGIGNMPDLFEFEKNVSLVLTNNHYAEEYGRSLPPLVVPVGGMHCFQSKETTPKDIETFMNNSGSAGFMLVSFGSAAHIAKLPTHLKEIFFNATRKAKTNFLMKWNGEIPDDMPKNVHAAAWLPQQNVLAHPNIKGFITHGGLLGIQEAICSGVPLIVAPIFAEQDYNGQRIHSRKRGIKIELKTLTQEELDNAIDSLLTDPSYKQNMVEASKLFLDRPQSPIDTAVWWTEFILRYGQVDLLKPLGIHQSWYERRLIDVWFVLYTILVVTITLFVHLLLKICNRRSRTDAGNTKKRQ